MCKLIFAHQPEEPIFCPTIGTYSCKSFGVYLSQLCTSSSDVLLYVGHCHGPWIVVLTFSVFGFGLLVVFAVVDIHLLFFLFVVLLL